MFSPQCFYRFEDKCIKIAESYSSFDEAAPEILKFVCKYFTAEWGTYWKVNSVLYTLNAFYVHVEPGHDFSRLVTNTKSRSLSMSEGNAGHVWRSKIPILSNNLVNDMCIPRSLDANKGGVNSGVWFALKSDDTVFGVIELLAKKLPSSNTQTLHLLEALGTKLGYFFRQKIVEQ